MIEKVFAAGVLAVSIKTGRFLLIQRRKDVIFPMQWSVPGGSMDEDDEYPKNAALREFYEETKHRIKVVSKQPLYYYDDRLTSFYTYLGFTTNEFIPDLKGETKNGPENVNYGWYTFDELPDNLVMGTKDMLDENRDLIEAITANMRKNGR